LGGFFFGILLLLTFNGATERGVVMLPKLPFDGYEVRSRLAVALIVGLPVVAPVLALAPADWPSRLGFGAVALFLLYGFGFCIAGLGRRLERRLWSRWGGPPSTRLCRWRDDTWGKPLKQRLHEAVARTFGLDLFQRRRERENPEGADRAIHDAFARVRSYLRRHDPNGLWATHNAEYGFSRNLTASATLGASVAMLAGAACLACWRLRDDLSALALAVVDGVLVPLFVTLRCVMPAVTKQRAERYAESAWQAFLNLADTTAPPVPPTRSPSPTETTAADSTTSPSPLKEEQP
jgi:hypothetical protein